ncbi:MAG: fused response regulator/phosphatase [Alphaproteobacteria bacterium]|nr:fused response regulator/phosphatase [Rhodospirillales bacterium]MCW9045124.1 fused response regulator/phosphatase [Alphaproteobacteria bacterium]
MGHDAIAADDPGKDIGLELATSLLESRILVIEDDEIAQIMIEGFLEAAGFTNLLFAQDGEEGLHVVPQFNPELIILDIGMPRKNGYEVLAELRADPVYADLPVIVETAFDSSEERNRAFDAGATDLVAKPLNGAELLARLRIHLENRIFTRKLQAYSKRMADDLSLAREMQQDLVPSPSYIAHMAEKYNLLIDSVFEPSTELGGDFWGMQQMPDKNALAFINIDFTGHGVPAALNTFRLHSIIANTSLEDIDPGEYLSELNRRLHKTLPRGQYATATTGHLDFDNDKLHYAVAGGPPQFIKGPGETSFKPLDPSGMPLGISINSKYPTATVDFAKGSELFFCSDAIQESPNEHDEMLEDEGVNDLLNEVVSKSPNETALNALMDKFFAYAVPPISDDLTAVWIKRK